MSSRRGFFSLLTALLGLFSLPLSSGLTALGDDDLRSIPSPGKDFDIHDGKLLAPILIPRVSGTEGSLKTQRHFVDFFKANLPRWEIVWQNSSSTTPLSSGKEVPFANIIFRRDPPGRSAGDISRLTLVAHYDSKYSPKGFIGAMDSAAPCAMLLHVARSIDDALEAKWAAKEKLSDGLEEEEGVQIIMMDGEEAFVTWTDDDSLYGARSLAAEWESSMNPLMSAYSSPLKSISLFVLLDLLGPANPRVPSYFLNTHWAYKSMALIEKRMRELKLLESNPPAPFLPEVDKPPDRFGRGFIEDDHVPFMKRGVEILHLIPSPFPDTWHKIEDDGEHLDLPTVRDWAQIMVAFTAEWMDLKGFTNRKRVAGNKRSETSPSMSGDRTEL